MDLNDKVLISLNRPSVLLKQTMNVVGADGTRGAIVQKTLGVFSGTRFELVSRDRAVGTLKAKDGKAWNFTIEDAAGVEIARITKTWAGWSKERFTKADNYVVQIHKPIEEPLRSLTIATALAVDIALKQGKPSRRRSRGWFGLRSRRQYK